MRKVKILWEVALAVLLALSLTGAIGSAALSARGHVEGITWETGTAARGPLTPGQGVTWESGVSWD